MPRETKKGWTYAYIIRQQYIQPHVMDVAEIYWGAPSAAGLQAGVQLEPRNTKYASGQQVTPTFYYRNTGTEPLDTTFPNLMTRGYYDIVAVDSFGKAISIEQDQTPAVPVGWRRFFLQPGDLQEIHGPPILLGGGDLTAESQPAHPSPQPLRIEPSSSLGRLLVRGLAAVAIRASPGQTVRLDFELRDPQQKDAPRLKTGEVVFFLGESQESDAAVSSETNSQPVPNSPDARQPANFSQ